MQREQIRQAITAQFYQSLAESNVQVRSIPQNELQAIVNALADGVFAALAAIEEEADSAAGRLVPGAIPAADANGSGSFVEEQLLWRGRPYLSIGTVYELTNQRLRIIRGLLGNTIDEIELIRVKDTRVKQHLGERLLDVGDITIISDDASNPEIMLHNVRNPVEVRELIRKAVQEEKQRRGLRYREELE